jgi:hypothetical protein
MSGLRDQRRQAADLVRLREVRMRAAAARLAEARIATAVAERARFEADEAATQAADAHQGAKEGLTQDPGEAERLLAVLDRRRFERSLAIEALSDARDAEHARVQEEGERRKAMILAQARHDVLAERLQALHRRAGRMEEERVALDAEDVRRFR